MKEPLEYFGDLNFIDSVKLKNTINFLQAIVAILDDIEIEKLKKFLGDEDLQDDLLVLSTVFAKNFKSESIPQFLLNFEKNLSKCEAPQFKNEKTIGEFLFFLRDIFQKETMPRQKLPRHGAYL